MGPDGRRRPLAATAGTSGLVALCGLIALLEVAAWLLVAPFLARASLPGALGWLVGQRLLLMAALAALLPGCYAAARENLGPRSAIGAARTRIASQGQPLLVSMLVSRAVAIGLAAGALFVAVTVLGALDTASVWTDAFLGVGPDRRLLALVGLPVAVVAASWLGRGAVALHDLRTIAGESPGGAAIWSLSVWRGRLRRFLPYAAIRGTLLALPPLVALCVTAVLAPSAARTLTAPPPGTVAVAAVAFVLAVVPTRAVLVTYQLSTHEDVRSDVRAIPTETTTLRRRHRRALLAGVLVLGTAVGVGAVRTADVQPGPAATFEVTPADASATIETAIERTRTRDLITVQRTAVRNESTGGWEQAVRREGLLQRSDRSARVYVRGDRAAGGPRALYATDGELGMLHNATLPSTPGPLAYTMEQPAWTVLVGQSYEWGSETAFGYPPADAAWRLAERSPDTLVYRLVDPASLAGHDGGALPRLPEDGAALGGDTEARIVIDRRLLTVSRARLTVDYGPGADGPAAIRWERENTAVGGVTAHRPASLGPPSVPARLWDVVYY